MFNVSLMFYFNLIYIVMKIFKKYKKAIIVMNEFFS